MPFTNWTFHRYTLFLHWYLVYGRTSVYRNYWVWIHLFGQSVPELGQLFQRNDFIMVRSFGMKNTVQHGFYLIFWDGSPFGLRDSELFHWRHVFYFCDAARPKSIFPKKHLSAFCLLFDKAEAVVSAVTEPNLSNCFSRKLLEMCITWYNASTQHYSQFLCRETSPVILRPFVSIWFVLARRFWELSECVLGLILTQLLKK